MTCLPAIQFVVLIVATALFGIRAGELRAAEDVVEVEEHGNLAYRPRESVEIISRTNLLDVYAPQSKSKLPVVLLVHGGAWITGDKSLDFIPQIARKVAREGFVVVAVNYRLSPMVRHPAHIQDVAKALAWVVANIDSYGGCPDEVFLMGHSAGGHLVSLLATDPQYAKDAGVSQDIIRGVITVSGVYEISTLTINSVLGDRRELAGFATATSPFAVAFGTDAENWQAASPQNHVREGLPPFLIISASCDLPTLATMAEDFHAALKEKQVDATLLKTRGRTHATGFWRMAMVNDATFRSVSDFLSAHKRQAADSRVHAITRAE